MAARRAKTTTATGCAAGTAPTASFMWATGVVNSGVFNARRSCAVGCLTRSRARDPQHPHPTLPHANAKTMASIVREVTTAMHPFGGDECHPLRFACVFRLSALQQVGAYYRFNAARTPMTRAGTPTIVSAANAWTVVDSSSLYSTPGSSRAASMVSAERTDSKTTLMK